MKPIVYVTFQLVVLAWAAFAVMRRDPSLSYRLLWAGAFGGVIGLDYWYLATYAYPTGFAF